MLGIIVKSVPNDLFNWHKTKPNIFGTLDNDVPNYLAQNLICAKYFRHGDEIVQNKHLAQKRKCAKCALKM